MHEYKNFSIKDFVQDEFFNRWVKDPSLEIEKIWEAWLVENPEMSDIVEESRNIILAFNYPPPHLPANFYHTLKGRIDSTIINETDNTSRTFQPGPWIALAAVITGLIIAASVLFTSSPSSSLVIYSSKYAEIKKIFLPDGSEVVLNANSILRYKDSSDKKYREAWLEGEGFFRIKHLEDADKVPGKFIVHSKDVIVDVLGTEFNVSSVEGNETEVLLTKGIVRLSVEAAGAQAVTMIPDQHLSYNSKTKHFTVNKAAASTYTAWMNHKLILEKTTLENVTRELYRYYGKPVFVQNAKMLKQQLSGTLELQDEDALTETLSVLLAVRVSKNEHQIVIHSK